MDLDPVIQAAATLVSTVLAALLGYVGLALREWLARQRVETALGRAAGLVLADPRVRAGVVGALGDAAALGAVYVQKAIPATLAQLAVPPERVRDMVLAEAAKALQVRP